MKTLPALKPNDSSLKLTRVCGSSLTSAFQLYIVNRDQFPNFDKEKYRNNIFKSAQDTFKDSLVYMESVGASYFFHIKDRDGVVRVYDTHLTQTYREEYSNYSILRETEVF